MPSIDNPVSVKTRKFRRLFSTIALVIMIVLWVGVDPDAGFITNLPYGAKLLMIFVTLSKMIPYVLALHVTRKVLHDYMDLELYLKKANDTSEGAGLAIVGMGLLCIAYAIVIFAATSTWG